MVVNSTLLISCGSSDTGKNYIDSNSKRGNFDDHRGQWVVINYWATWCKPCIKEIPELNQFSKTQAQKVILFGVDFDNSQGEELKEKRDKLAIEFPVLTEDPAAILGFDRPAVLPTTLVINPQGELSATLLGPQTAHSLQQAIGI